MKSLREDEFLDLIDRIYDAGMSFDRWPDALTRMADLLGARDASLGAMAPEALPWIFAPRTDPEFMRVYAEAYHPLDQVWHGVTQRAVGQATSDAMVMPREALEKSAFHNEWSRPQGYSTIMGSMVLAEDGWRTVLMMPGRETFDREQLRALRMLTPHLRRAVQMNIRLAQGDLQTQATATLLREMGAAAFVLDAGGRVLFANPAAEELFRSGAVRVAQGMLAGAEGAADLRTLAARCALGGSAADGGIVEVARPRQTPLRLRVTPVRRETPLLGPGVAAAIVFDITGSAPDDPVQRLRRRYGLTAAEAVFALEIVKGDGKPAVAERLGISFSTARTHLSRIFEKTGVHRQAELVRLVLGLEDGDEAR
ncbi:MAG: LuxR C-terminal-related transcriptional regulator [Pseudomonadota bacterium]